MLTGSVVVVCGWGRDGGGFGLLTDGVAARGLGVVRLVAWAFFGEWVLSVCDLRCSEVTVACWCTCALGSGVSGSGAGESARDSAG